jgi:rfaE bifunctional protein nucleotidyltransferase chain/domain
MTTLSEAQALQLEQWHQDGRRIVFTNGVFDLLHAGHLAQLRAARSLGDVLIVGLNSDSSVRQLQKGQDRPVVPEASRAELLRELRCVDMVLLFEEPTPLDLIMRVHPTVLVKGGDYRDQIVVGRAEVEGWGGHVEFVELVPGESTSALLQRIRELKP